MQISVIKQAKIGDRMLRPSEGNLLDGPFLDLRCARLCELRSTVIAIAELRGHYVPPAGRGYRSPKITW